MALVCCFFSLMIFLYSWEERRARHTKGPLASGVSIGTEIHECIKQAPL